MKIRLVLPSFALALLLLSGCAEKKASTTKVPPAPEKQASATANATKPAPARPQPAPTVDKAAAYYHYSLAHYYEDQATMTGRSDLVSKAVDEYRLAADADPTSGFLDAELA